MVKHLLGLVAGYIEKMCSRLHIFTTDSKVFWNGFRNSNRQHSEVQGRYRRQLPHNKPDAPRNPRSDPVHSSNPTRVETHGLAGKKFRSLNIIFYRNKVQDR